jgi:hypothetical protein
MPGGKNFGQRFYRETQDLLWELSHEWEDNIKMLVRSRVTHDKAQVDLMVVANLQLISINHI